MTKSKLPLDIWISGMNNFVMTCVDNILFKIDDNEVRKVLLGIRTQPPAKGCLYPIGSLNFKNDFSREAALYVSKKETGLRTRVIKPFGYYEKVYSEVQHPEIENGLHNNCIAYLTRILGGDLRTDETHSGFRWIKSPEELPLPPYTEVLLEDSGVFTKSIEELLKEPDESMIIHRELDYREFDFSPCIIQNS